MPQSQSQVPGLHGEVPSYWQYWQRLPVCERIKPRFLQTRSTRPSAVCPELLMDIFLHCRCLLLLWLLLDRFLGDLSPLLSEEIKTHLHNAINKAWLQGRAAPEQPCDPIKDKVFMEQLCMDWEPTPSTTLARHSTCFFSGETVSTVMIIIQEL